MIKGAQAPAIPRQGNAVLTAKDWQALVWLLTQARPQSFMSQLTRTFCDHENKNKTPSLVM